MAATSCFPCAYREQQRVGGIRLFRAHPRDSQVPGAVRACRQSWDHGAPAPVASHGDLYPNQQGVSLLGKHSLLKMLNSQKHQVMGVTGQAQCIIDIYFLPYSLLAFAFATCASFLFPPSCCLAASQECDGDFLHVVPVPKHCLAHGRDGWSTSSAQTLCPGPCSLQEGSFGGWQSTSTKTFANHITYKLQLFSILYCDPL